MSTYTHIHTHSEQHQHQAPKQSLVPQTEEPWIMRYVRHHVYVCMKKRTVMVVRKIYICRVRVPCCWVMEFLAREVVVVWRHKGHNFMVV